ncbi:MAG: hypothetical protein DRN57_05875 [Thermoplasmata archaeon]|nr:MAG: hypothetical protein DRN57_05875 [Thermoplasmata archaeon]
MSEQGNPRAHRSFDLEPGPAIPSGKAKKLLFSPPFISGLSGSRIIENLYLVSSGIRHSSMFHPVDRDEILLVHKAAGMLGLGMKIRKAGSMVLKVFLYDASRTREAEMIPDMDESMGDREFITAQITLANFSGHFLDFPRCCTESFVKHLMNATDQDAEASRQLLECPDPEPEAYFVERFVPCSPTCPNAAAEGARIERELRSLDRDVHAMYLELRREHMTEVREGRILKEKRERDLLLGLL